MSEKIILVMFCIVSLVLFFVAIFLGVGRSVDNQSVMLCNSAKQSGNEIWLDRCELYYQTGDVRDIK